MAVSPIPDGYHTLTPYLIIEGAARALSWYAEAFGAIEVLRMPIPGGKIGHAEMQIGNSRFMLADENPEHGATGPVGFGGSPVTLHLYVPDVDAMMARAIAAGGKLKTKVENKFYGDRLGTVGDPFGYVWHLATHIEDVTPEEIARRMKVQSGAA